MGIQVASGHPVLNLKTAYKKPLQSSTSRIQFLGQEDPAETVSKHSQVKPKSFIKKGLLATLMGLLALTPTGCTTDVGRMEKALEEIPATQTENRIEFLKKQLRHENPKVVAKALEHLGNSSIALKEKTELVLEYLQNNQQKVIDAANKLGEKLANSTETPLNLRQALQRTMSSRPWVESYVESHTEWTFHFGMNPFNKYKYEYHYGPETKYETKYIHHGNSLTYQAAHKEVREILETLK